MADDAGQPAKLIQVLLVADDDSFGRLGGIIQHFCVGMIDDPVQIRVLLRTNRPTVPDAIGPSPVLRVRYRRWTFDRHWPEDVLDLLDDDPPDIVHGLSARLCRWARHMSLAWKCGLVAHVTDLEDVRQFRHLVGEPALYGVPVTSHLHEVMAKQWPGLRDRIRMVPFGVPAEREPACLSDPDRVPAALVSTPLTGDCGLDVVLKALATIIRGGQEVQLFLLAGGRAEPGFRRQVDALGLRQYLTFAGEMGDSETVGAAMLGADFFIEPNPNRRFSAHALTAMADGLAILAPHGTLQDYLIDGTTARLFNPVKAGDLAEQWSQLLQHRSAARLLAQSALDYARTHHQATRMVTATVALYQEICPSPNH